VEAEGEGEDSKNLFFSRGAQKSGFNTGKQSSSGELEDLAKKEEEVNCLP